MSTSNLKSSKWGKTTSLSDLDKIRIEVPDGLKVNVHQDSANEYNINIPPYRGNDLSNAALESVARDKSGTTWCTTCTTTTPICIGSLASLTCA